ADGQLVDRPVLRLDPAGMTRYAARADAPLKAPMLREVVARRHVPLFLRRVPSDRRLMQKALDLDEIAAAKVARADQVADGQVHAADLLAFRRSQYLLVVQLPVLAVDAIRAAGGLVEERAIGRLGPGVEVGERPTVRRVQERFVVPA